MQTDFAQNRQNDFGLCFVELRSQNMRLYIYREKQLLTEIIQSMHFNMIKILV